MLWLTPSALDASLSLRAVSGNTRNVTATLYIFSSAIAGHYCKMLLQCNNNLPIESGGNHANKNIATDGC
jgi:hypothetical protein